VIRPLGKLLQALPGNPARATGEALPIPSVVPLRGALVVLAILAVLALTLTLCLLAHLSTQAVLPSPGGRGSDGRGAGGEVPGEAGSSLPSPFSPRPLAGEGPGVRVQRPAVRPQRPRPHRRSEMVP